MLRSKNGSHKMDEAITFVFNPLAFRHLFQLFWRPFIAFPDMTQLHYCEMRNVRSIVFLKLRIILHELGTKLDD